MATSNLAITELTTNQTGKTVTINDALEKIDGATQGELAISFTTNARTLNGTEFTSHVCFKAGALTGTGALTVPLTNRLFVVDNTANSSHDITVAGASGGSATVSGGKVALLYCDGTDVKAFTATAASVNASDIAALDFSALPTSNPGSGKLWLNGGVLQVGA